MQHSPGHEYRWVVSLMCSKPTHAHGHTNVHTHTPYLCPPQFGITNIFEWKCMCCWQLFTAFTSVLAYPCCMNSHVKRTNKNVSYIKVPPFLLKTAGFIQYPSHISNPFVILYASHAVVHKCTYIYGCSLPEVANIFIYFGQVCHSKCVVHLYLGFTAFFMCFMYKYCNICFLTIL